MRSRRPTRMRRLVMALACASLAMVGALPSTAAAGPRAHSSVVGGAPADPGQWPYAVAIYRKGRLHCGGAVIGPTKVLTAAHCVDGFDLANFTVIAGRPNLRDAASGQTLTVASGRVHPDFEETGLHDIAVLNLAQPTSVTPVALATPDQNAATTFTGALLRVAGWGAVNPLGVHLSPFLKTTFEKVRTDARCLRAYTRDLFVPESMICALGNRRKHGGKLKIHTSACSGDSGGPLVADTSTSPVVVGTVSFGGALCGLPGAPTVYSRVSASLDFINAG
jgi:secreted trypsin-like serine protease